MRLNIGLAKLTWPPKHSIDLARESLRGLETEHFNSPIRTKESDDSFPKNADHGDPISYFAIAEVGGGVATGLEDKTSVVTPTVEGRSLQTSMNFNSADAVNEGAPASSQRTFLSMRCCMAYEIYRAISGCVFAAYF